MDNCESMINLEKLNDPKILSDFRVKEEGDCYFCKVKRSKFTVTIPKTIDWKISYLAGVLAGDGSVKMTNRKVSKYPRVSLEIFNNSLEYLKYADKLFGDIYNIKGRLRKKPDKNCYILAINNKVTWLYFNKVLGFLIGKKDCLRVPEKLRNPALLKHFIAGLIDTDGYKTNTFGLMMSGSNSKFLEEIAELTDHFYSLKFYGPYHSTIHQNGKIRYRAILNLARTQSNFQKFRELILLKHPRFNEWARRESNPRSLPCKGSVC